MAFLSTMLELLFPNRCVICRGPLPVGRKVCCDRCSDTVVKQERLIAGKNVTLCVSALCYSGGVRESVVGFKFQGKSGYATEFGRILADVVDRRLAGRYDLITWIPVSEERKKKRGYDQAMLLAMAAALELGDVAVETLEKSVDNPAQSGLSRDARCENVKGVYRVPDRILVEGKRILLIDDVVTTGATMEEAAQVLLEAGAKEVYGAALAHPEEEK